MAHFLAQAGAETNLAPVREGMSYSDAGTIMATFPKYFKPDSGVQSMDFVNKPKDLGDRVYSNRMGNDAGEGYLYRGGGLLQTTGRNNYTELQALLNDAGYTFPDGGRPDVLSNPDQLKDPDLAVFSALVFYNVHVSPLKADGGYTVENVSKAVNGGTNGLSTRINNYNRAIKVLRPDAGP